MTPRKVLTPQAAMKAQVLMAQVPEQARCPRPQRRKWQRRQALIESGALESTPG